MIIFVFVRKAWYILALLYDFVILGFAIRRVLDIDISRIWAKRYLGIIAVWVSFIVLEIFGFLGSFFVSFLRRF